MMITQKIKIELSYEIAILLLDTYPQKLKAGSQRDVCTLMFNNGIIYNSQNIAIQVSIDR